MSGLSANRWEELLRWLHMSGLALYFLERVTELGGIHSLPPLIRSRLQQNLAENTERTQTLIRESVAIQRQFQEAGLRYAMLKGPSLWPIAVRRPELRCQFDMDFLIDEEDGIEARRILELRGYRLNPGHLRALDANSEIVWDFRWNERPWATLRDIYKAAPSYAVELHMETRNGNRRSLLNHALIRDLFGMRVPVLAPVDLFISQGMHAFKHVCSSFFRVSHLLEFRRHVMARRDEDRFWQEVRSVGQGDLAVQEGLGVVILLLTNLLGDFAPLALTSWTVDCLRPAVRLWTEMFSRRSVLASYPGTKLYLLLNRELAARKRAETLSFSRGLFPVNLPHPPVRRMHKESLSFRLGRYRMHAALIFVRLRLHTLEGIRCLWQARKFRQRIALLAKG